MTEITEAQEPKALSANVAIRNKIFPIRPRKKRSLAS
jgi:hypothetical protein